LAPQDHIRCRLIVFIALVVVALMEALDAYGRRR
jgi:hypothetical protein